MLQSKGSRKATALTLLIVFMTNTFAPSLSYALTSGPTQPEATSFEPVDTTNMVNLQTGGLAYNVPLIEVPGPEGGYPLSLSYHAGIQPNQDASWVGLGWTLNPGAISRTVNGYPDEWNGINTTSHVYWAGGTTSTFSIGISLPVGGGAGISFGLSFASDTYQGSDFGWSYGIYAGINSYLSVSVGMTVLPYGQSYESFGIGVTGSEAGLNGSFGLSYTTNMSGSNSVGFSAGVSLTSAPGTSLVGADLSTGGNQSSFTVGVGGYTSHVSSSNYANVQTKSSGWSLSKFGLPISLGYNKERYYIDQNSNISTYGSLVNYGWTVNSDYSLPDNVAFDTYSLLEAPTDKNMIDYPDPTVLQGGAFDDYDNYTVVAQGLGGNIRPYKFLGISRGQNMKNSDGTYRSKYYSPLRPGSIPASDPIPQFRFVGDFSNSYRQNYLAYATNALNASSLNNLTAPFDPSPAYGNNDGLYGYDNIQNILPGSRQVTVGITINPYNALGYTTPTSNPPGSINGFTIVNESGVKYTFGLAAYEYSEEVYQEMISRLGGLSFNRQTKPQPYAYTWYLTSITGPDFVDRNGNGMADDGDWGYWVNFEYGKWSSDYVWRNPSEGFNTDDDNGWQNCSMGNREVYYLNAIRTRSHVALFEKAVRTDAKGASNLIFTKNMSGATPIDYTYPGGVFDNSSVSSMNLTHIYLLNSSDENFVTPSSGTLNANVLDSTDVNAVGRSNLQAKAIRVIDFNYNYSLCANTTNSFITPGQTFGKLTLTSLVTRGKQGANLLPPVQFQYDLGSSANTQAGVTLSPANFTTTNGTFNVGDMIMCSNPNVYCGVVTARTLSGSTYTYTLSNNMYTGSTITATVYTTKNPPYNKDFFDIWGMYKSDANLSLIGTDASTYRKTTLASSSGVDAWSLRTITSQLGSTINIGYGSNTMSSSAVNNDFPISSATFNSEQSGLTFSNFNFTISASQPGYSFYNLVVVGTTGSLVVQTTSSLSDPRTGRISNYYNLSSILTFTVSAVDANGTIHATASAPIIAGSSYNAIFFINNMVNLAGGGVRVNAISLQSAPGSQIFTTAYNYNVPGTAQSSGTTSYMPVGVNFVSSPFRPAYLNIMSPIYALAREIPPPGVMYQFVSVTKQVKNPDEANTRTLEGSNLYQFEVFKSNMAGRVEVVARQSGANSGLNQYARYPTVDNFTSCVGAVKRMVQYDVNGNKLAETINHYLHDNLINESLQNFMTDYKNLLASYNYQGYLQERYAEVKTVNNETIIYTDLDIPPDVAFKSTVSARESFPCIQTGQTIINYVNGTQTNTNNLAFDFYSGEKTKTLNTDAYGNNLMTESIPAYREYPSMGLKIFDPNNGSFNNFNMLSQVAEARTWKVDANNNPVSLTAASVNVWGNQSTALDYNGVAHIQDGRYESSSPNGNVWRIQSKYSWKATNVTSDGTTPLASFSDFNWSTPSSSNANWINATNITLYDVYSKALEESDVNGNFSASHMNYGDKKVVLTGGPAKFYEIAFSGAEDAGVSQTAAMFVQAANGVQTSAAAHTGTQSLLLGTSGQKGFLYNVPTSSLTAGRTYLASVWVKPVSGSSSTVQLQYTINGTVKSTSIASGSSTKTANGWYLINLVVNGTDIAAGNTLNVYCINNDAAVQAYVDDFRFQPINASTTAYVYDPSSGELDYALDNSNIYTNYIYDGSGRLISVKREKLGTGVFQAKSYQYNYSTASYASAAINQSFTKNNCPPSSTGLNAGTAVSVTVPAGQFTSFLSQADANSHANTYAQDYANTHGTCVCSPSFTFASGISNIVNTTTLSGTTAKFTLVFTYPTGQTLFTLGNFTTSCCYPSATRTVPIQQSSTLYNVIFNTNGTVQVQLVSGTGPTGTVGLSGQYDLLSTTYYSAAASGTFTKSCTPPQVGSSVTYNVAPYIYNSTTSQAAANQLAQNDVNANGQNYANANGTCSTPCSFAWGSSFTGYTSSTITSSGTSASFYLAFVAPTNGYTGGTLGTISSGCAPSGTRSMSVTDGSNSSRVWYVIIYSSGSVSISLQSGTAPTNSYPPVVLSGTYSK